MHTCLVAIIPSWNILAGNILSKGIFCKQHKVLGWPCRYCVKKVHIRSFSGPNFPAFGLNMERKGVSLRIQSKCGKIWARKTPNVDSFLAVRIIYFRLKFVWQGFHLFIDFFRRESPYLFPFVFAILEQIFPEVFFL